MTRGDRRRNRRRYKVRYDRIIVVVLIFIVLIVLITSCTKAISKKDDTDAPDTSTSESRDTSDTGQESSGQDQVQPATEQAQPDDGFTAEKHSHDEIYKGSLVLVNNQYDYKFPEGDITPTTIFDNRNDYYDVSDYVTKVDFEVLNKINSMMEAFVSSNARTGSGIYVIDGYRTYEEQADRYSSGKSSFEPGHSDYHTGRTFDLINLNDESLTEYFSAEGNYAWFAENAEKYGFVVRFPEGKSDYTGERPRTYTYRYVGVPHAAYMNSKGLCLEEYIDELKTYTKDEPLEITGDAVSYKVYFVPAAESGDTDVPVPTGKSYSISGNNVDGFIVTVTE